MAAFYVGNIISRFLNVGMAGGRLTTQVAEEELHKICQKAKEVFISQKGLIEVDPFLFFNGKVSK